MHDAAVAPGALLADKYRVVRELGRGGMGIVVEARHELLGTHVAIKILTAAALAQEGATSRFLREARAAAGLKSEFVARVTDFGTLADGRPFMVMELLEGEDFAVALKRGLPRSEAVDAILQACAGLAEAHAAGIIHRDLKPSNLFRTRRPDGSFCTKILDFGISKLQKPDALVDATTKSSVLLGTPYYMSPEQVRSSKSVDSRTDVWQMGVVLHQAMTGALPFDGDNVGMLFAQILEVPAPPARQAVADLPAPIEAAILACLEKSPDRRLPSIAQLASWLEDFGGSEGRVAAQRARAMSGAGTAAHAAEPSLNPSSSSAQRAAAEWTEAPVVSRATTAAARPVSPLVWVGVALGAIALGATGAVLWWFPSGGVAPGSEPVSSARELPPGPASAATVEPSIAAVEPAPSASAAASTAPSASSPPAASTAIKPRPAPRPPAGPPGGPASPPAGPPAGAPERPTLN